MTSSKMVAFFLVFTIMFIVIPMLKRIRRRINTKRRQEAKKLEKQSQGDSLHE